MYSPINEITSDMRALWGSCHSLLAIMARIHICCSGMRTMIDDGVLTPHLAFGLNTGEMYVRGREEEKHYTDVQYYPFCGAKIEIEK